MRRGEPVEYRLRLRGRQPAYLRALYLVDQEQVHLVEVALEHRGVEGRGIEHDAHPARVGGVDYLAQAVHLVLQQHHVARAEAGERLRYVLRRDAAVRAAVDDDAVLALGVHLDYGVACRGVLMPYERGVHPAALQRFDEQLAARAADARVPDRQPGLGHGDGLVEPLAAREDLAPRGEYRLPRPDDVVQGIDVVDVHGTKAQSLHARSLLRPQKMQPAVRITLGYGVNSPVRMANLMPAERRFSSVCGIFSQGSPASFSCI